MKNSHINLEPTSKERVDALGCLKYTIFLEMELPDHIPDFRLVPTILEICKTNCRELFANSDTDIWFLFFGLTSKKSTLSYLDVIGKTNSTGSDQELPSLIDMILKHCIISAYHAILTALFQNKFVTANNVCNKLNTNINQLAENYNFCKSQGIEAKNNARKAQDFNKKTANRLKRLEHMKQLFIQETAVKSDSPAKDIKDSSTDNAGIQGTPPDKTESLIKNPSERKAEARNSETDDINHKHPKTGEGESKNTTIAFSYNLQFAKFWKAICDTPISKWNIGYKNRSSSKWKRIFENLDELYQLLDKSFGDPIDKIYFKYIKERIFGYDLINCLVQNIAAVESKFPSLINSDMLNIICQCKILPNTFSRIYFIQYAFEQLLNRPNSYFDYWYHREKLPNHAKYQSALDSLNGMPEEFSLQKWTIQFSYFCNYMAKFIIPVFEWCFLELFLRYIEKASPNATHDEHLIRAKNILSEYITKNETEILGTFPPDTGLSLIRPKKDLEAQLEILPNYYKNTLLEQIFINQSNIELNLTPINPEFFLGKRQSDRFKPFVEDYRTFIIQQIKALYLDEKNPI